MTGPKSSWKDLRTWTSYHYASTALALAFVSWGWALMAGMGSMTTTCRELEPAERATLYAASGIVPFNACSTTLAWYWFLVVFQFTAVALGAMAVAGEGANALRPGAIVLLAIITTLLMDSTKTFMQLHYNASGEFPEEYPSTATAANGAVAGGILCIVFNVLACIALGWREDCCCCTDEHTGKSQLPK